MRYLGAAIVSLLLAACEPAPESTYDYFGWQENVSDMRSALMGACTYDGNVYAVGGPYESGTLYWWTTRRWLQEGSMLQGERLWACWAGSEDRIIAVGQNGAIFRHTAEGWRRDEVPSDVREADFYGVWGMADGTAVAVGGGLSSPSETSVILHFDGTSWTRANSDSLGTKTLRHVWGSSPDDYWAVGDDGVVGHFDGVDWRPTATRVDDRLYGVYGNGPNEIYAVGGSGRGVVLRWNGSSWLQFDETSQPLRTIWTSPGGPLFVGGDSGYVARYGRDEGLPQIERVIETAPFPHLRINGLLGFGSAVLGVASTMEVDDETGDWRGAIVGHRRSFGGPIFESPRPDAGMPTPEPDASLPMVDAGP